MMAADWAIPIGIFKYFNGLLWWQQKINVMCEGYLKERNYAIIW